VDEHGHNQFENQRSQMGELVYRLKYRQDDSAVPEIVTLLDQLKGIESFDLILPIPPTKARKIQPVPAIAVALGKRRSVEVRTDLLTSSGTKELKEVTDPVERRRLLHEAISLNDPGGTAGKKILLVDDLFRSGATLEVATEILMSEGRADSVSVLAMTKTRSNR
jgi:predicted amidophosphoribosyltransferase